MNANEYIVVHILDSKLYKRWDTGLKTIPIAKALTVLKFTQEDALENNFLSR